ncbi:MAG: iron ABC transporter permease [Bdellovibrionia bacterium]
MLGIYFASQFAAYEWRFKRIQRLLVLVPYLVPNFVLATAYVVAWNPATGLLNPVLKFPNGLYGIVGMTVLFGVVHVPVAFLMLEEKIRRIDSSLREAARLSGAGTLTIFRRIELPLLWPTVGAATALCFALNISAFAIPSWIGAPEKSYPLTYRIYQALQVGGHEGMPLATAYSVILFAIVVPALFIAAYTRRNERKFQTVSGKGARRAPRIRSPRTAAVFQTVFWVSQTVLWIAPLTALFVSTFVPPGCLQANGLACFADFTTRSYSYVLFELPETSIAFKGSFLYGTLSAIIIVLLCVFSLMAFSKNPVLLQALEWIFSLPAATPGAIIALGLIVTYSGRFEINLYNTAGIVVMAFVIKHANLSFQTLRTGLANISVSLLEAARLSGAGTRQVWTKIVLPILWPEMTGGFFLVLVPILGELTMSIFLVSPSFRSIGTLLFDLQDYADQASAAALSIILVVAVLALNETARLVSKGRLGY